MALTLHTAPTVLPVAGPPIRDGAVAVDDGRIVWVGPLREWIASEGATRAGSAAPERVEPERVDWSGLLAPGLVNAHAHLQYSAYADMCTPGVDFLDWISTHAPRNRTMTGVDWQRSTATGVAALLRSGTTAVADVVAVPEGIDVVATAGLAGISYVEAVGADDDRWPTVRARLLSLLSGSTGPSDGSGPSGRSGPNGGSGPNGRQLGVSPHTLYTLGTEVIRDCVRLARKRGLRLHPHAAESPYEVEYVASGSGPFAVANQRWGLAMELAATGGSGRTPVAELAAVGGLGPDSHVAHGVQCDAADRAALRAASSVVALCPRSNVVLGVGEAPVAAYRAEGNPVAVGTDSLASAPTLDLLADVAALRALALAQGSPEAGLDQWLVEAATLGGARAMGLSDVGALRPGARADFAVFDVDGQPDPYAALAGAAGRCVGTVLAGQLVHRAET